MRLRDDRMKWRRQRQTQQRQTMAVAGCWDEARLGREKRAAGKHDVGRSVAVAGHRDQPASRPGRETHPNSGGHNGVRWLGQARRAFAWCRQFVCWYGKRASREGRTGDGVAGSVDDEARSVWCLTRYSACRGYGALRISKAGDGDGLGGWLLETGRGLERVRRRRINRLQETLSSACPRTGTRMVMEGWRRATGSSVVPAVEVEKEKVGRRGGKGDRAERSTAQHAQH